MAKLNLTKGDQPESRGRCGVALFIGGRSALEYWRAVKSRDEAKPTRAKPAEGVVPKMQEIRSVDFSSLGIVTDPVVLIAKDARARRIVKGVRFRVWSECVTSGSFVKVSHGVFVASPEACFAQMAGELSFEQLVKLGMELCGSYALSSRADAGFLFREPLTSVRRLRCYLEKASGMNGAKRARASLSYVLDGSASPAETNLVMLLCLSTRRGGYGLPLPSRRRAS